MEVTTADETLVEIALSPFLKFTPYFGVNFLRYRGVLSVKLRRVFSLVCFFATVSCNATIIHYMFFSSDKLFKADGYRLTNYSNASVWNAIIDYVNYTLHAVSAHFLLLNLTRKKHWSKIAQITGNCIGILNITDNNHLARLQRKALAAAIYVLFQTLCLCYMCLRYYSGVEDWRRIFASVFSTFTQIYPEIALYLFVLTAHIIQITLRCLEGQVSNRELSKCLLNEWKINHVIVCETINTMNAALGPFLLLRITSTFVSITNSSFYLFGLREASSLATVDAMFILVDLMHLAIPCLSANGIHNEVDKLVMKLIGLRLTSKRNNDHEILNSLILQVKNTPTVSAAGFLDVNMALFVKTLGLSLTYFSLLYQQHLSERIL